MDSEQEMSEWRNLVGSVILNFGEIEFVTFKCLAHLPNENIFKTTSQLPFGRRIDLIVEILRGKENLKTSYDVIINKLTRAKKLSEYRNILAHNPLTLSIYEHKATGDILIERVITSERKKGKEITLDVLKKIAEETKEIAGELYVALSSSLGLTDEKIHYE